MWHTCEHRLLHTLFYRWERAGGWLFHWCHKIHLESLCSELGGWLADVAWEQPVVPPHFSRLTNSQSGVLAYLEPSISLDLF